MARIQACHDAAALTQKQRGERKRRERNALSLRSYDVRSPEVREAMALPPEGSRWKVSYAATERRGKGKVVELHPSVGRCNSRSPNVPA
jgi:hypothetical protein